MKILVVCGKDRSKHKVALNCIKFLLKEKKDNFYFCIEKNDTEIIRLLKKKKQKFQSKNILNFLNKLKKNEFDWLLNIWGTNIYSKENLLKFKNNLNIHPSFLPYGRGRDPYVWATQNNFPIGATIHQMSEKVDLGKYYVREKIKFKFPYTAGDIFDKCLKLSCEIFKKNWKKIRLNKIKKKKFTKVYKKVYKRKDLINLNFLNLNKKKNSVHKKFILRIMSQDFPFLKKQILYKNSIYNISVHLKKTNKKLWN